MKLRALILAGALTGSVAFAPAPLSTVADAEIGTGSANFTLTKNVPHVDGGRGSDIEFATLTYPDAAAAAAAGFVRNTAADADPVAAGIQKDLALAGTTGTKFYLYDITVPSDTYQTAAYACPANQGDTQVFTRVENGVTRTFTTYTVEDGGSAVAASVQCAKDAGLKSGGGTEGSAKNYTGTFIIEITNPFAPKAVAFIPVVEGSHNGSVHPSGNYFYNSNSSLITEVTERMPGIEVYDISDFSAIKRTAKLALPFVPASLGTESHDITFNAKGDRAYSAALSQGVIIDTTNPAAPKVLTSWVDPTIQVWHQADPIQVGDRTLLVVEDEVGGAAAGGFCPSGGVHVFDVTNDPVVPTKLGYWNIDDAYVMAKDSHSSQATASCTAHVFRLYPEANLMTIAYYNGGTRVVDLKGLAGIALGETAAPTGAATGSQPMKQIGFRRFPTSNEWAAKSPRITVDAEGKVRDFYVFANGIRGLDVLKFATGNGAAETAAAAQGRWYTPAEAAAVLPSNLTAQQIEASLPEFSCLLKR